MLRMLLVPFLGLTAERTWAPSSAPFLGGRLCGSSVWLELQRLPEEAGPLTRLCREWFSCASLSTRARASWKRELRKSLSSFVLRCHPSISSQRCRSAWLLRRKASGGGNQKKSRQVRRVREETPRTPPPHLRASNCNCHLTTGRLVHFICCCTSKLLVVPQQPGHHLVGGQLRWDPEGPSTLLS